MKKTKRPKSKYKKKSIRPKKAKPGITNRIKDLVPSVGDVTKVDSFQPSVNQIKFANALLTQIKKSSISAAAKSAGVSRATVYRVWFKIPEFNDWIIAQHKMYEAALLGAHIIGMKKGLERGDHNVLRLWDEKHGSVEAQQAPSVEIYIDEVKVSSTKGGSNNTGGIGL